MTGFAWTKEATEALREMWCNQGLSGRVIAQELTKRFGGVLSRSAVIGKTHRLDLSQSIDKTPRKKLAKTTQLKKHTQAKTVCADLAARAERASMPIPFIPSTPVPQIFVELPCAVEEPLPPADAKKITILDLGPFVCHWPIGDPREESFAFCGARSREGSPYCDHHRGIAYRPHLPRIKKRRGA